MIAALLDQRARDRIGRAVAIFGRPHPDALALDFFPHLGGKPFHINCSVKSGAGAINTSPLTMPAWLRVLRLRAPKAAPSSRPSTSDHDLRATAELLEHGDTFVEPAPDGAVDEGAAGFAVAE